MEEVKKLQKGRENPKERENYIADVKSCNDETKLYILEKSINHHRSVLSNMPMRTSTFDVSTSNITEYKKFQRCINLFVENGILLMKNTMPKEYRWNEKITLKSTIPTEKLLILIPPFIFPNKDRGFELNDKEYKALGKNDDYQPTPIHITDILIPILNGTFLQFIPNATDNHKKLLEQFIGFYITKRHSVNFKSLLSYINLLTPLNIDIKLDGRTQTLDGYILISIEFVEKGLMLNFGDTTVTIESLNQIESIKYSPIDSKNVAIFEKLYKDIKEDDRIDDVLKKLSVLFGAFLQ